MHPNTWTENATYTLRMGIASWKAVAWKKELGVCQAPKYILPNMLPWAKRESTVLEGSNELECDFFLTAVYHTDENCGRILL